MDRPDRRHGAVAAVDEGDVEQDHEQDGVDDRDDEDAVELLVGLGAVGHGDRGGYVLTARDPEVRRAAALLRDRAAREREGRCAVDGPDLLAAARAFGLEPELVLRAGEDLSEDALRALAVAGQEPELVAVLPLPRPAADDAPLPPRSLVLVGVRDHGNVGSILRTAVAFDVPQVVLTHPDADPFARRALRASLGAAFRPGLLRRGGGELRSDAPLVAAVRAGGVPPRELPDGAVVVLGGERHGLDAADVRRCDLAVTIPAHGFESLNVAAAAAILVAAVAR